MKNYYEMNLEQSEKYLLEIGNLLNKLKAYNEIALLMNLHQTLSWFCKRASDNGFEVTSKKAQEYINDINRFIYNRI